MPRIPQRTPIWWSEGTVTEEAATEAATNLFGGLAQSVASWSNLLAADDPAIGQVQAAQLYNSLRDQRGVRPPDYRPSRGVYCTNCGMSGRSYLYGGNLVFNSGHSCRVFMDWWRRYGRENEQVEMTDDETAETCGVYTGSILWLNSGLVNTTGRDTSFDEIPEVRTATIDYDAAQDL